MNDGVFFCCCNYACNFKFKLIENLEHLSSRQNTQMKDSQLFKANCCRAAEYKLHDFDSLSKQVILNEEGIG